MWLLFVCTAAVVCFILDRIINREYFKARGNCPGPKARFPILGTLGPIYWKLRDAQDLIPILMDISKKYDFFFQIDALRRIIYIISSPPEIEGHDTTATLLSFCTYELAKNPDVQERAFQEQLTIFGASDRQPTINEIQQMLYLDKIVKETLRLYPSVPMIGRTNRTPVKLSNEVVAPTGSQFLLNIYGLHRNPKYWDHPEVFNPDNFSPEAVAKRHTFAHQPFSSGPRNCIGMRFATVEAKVAMSLILRRFRILPVPEHKLKLQTTAFLTLVSGYFIQLQRRNQ